MKLEKIKTEEFDYIYSQMQQNFIIDEIRDKIQAYELLSDNSYSIYNIIENDIKVGFITTWELQDFLFVEHFVIYKEFRKKGYGSKALSLVKEIAGLVVLEVEHPLTDTAKKRINFYQNNGFIGNDYNYMQPSYRKGGNKVPLIIMSSTPIIYIDKVVDSLYKKVYKV